MIAEKFSLKTIFTWGLVLFALIFFGMTLTVNIYIYLLPFFPCGLYAAATERIAKAWISNITSRKDTATAIGSFAGFKA
jgi:MFS family permease